MLRIKVLTEHTGSLIRTQAARRFQKMLRKNKKIVPLASIEQNKRNTFEDYEIDKLTTKPANFTLQSNKDFHKESEGREGETKQSVLVDCDIQNDDEKGKRFIECENEKDDSSSDEEETEEDLEFDKLIKRIKLNLRSRKQGGLATIDEEKEDGEREYYLKVLEEKIKSFSIEEKMKYKDPIVEIKKVYRCYQQKMRKLDVLNYQALYAIDLLQPKEHSKLILVRKSTLQHGKPQVIPHYLWSRIAQKNTYDPMLKRVDELNKDLELVYVGQICLSWEMLCWQHEKIKELKQYDLQWSGRYNLVAAEFLHFQALIQRFLEEEPIQQGHRIQNYVKNRSLIRNVLQVPTLIDDSTKEKKEIVWGDEEDAIAIERLEQIIKESMQVFLEFVGDKDDGSVFHRVSHHKGNELEEEDISELLGDLRTQLHKKERKLIKHKWISENWIVRKFQKHNEYHDQFLAQVGLRLISKVINMKRLRKHHLIWCSEKLKQIKFVDRKIKMEYSILLFPC